MCLINIQAVRELYASAKDIGMILDKSVKEEKSGYELTKSLILPPILLDASEVWRFYYPDMEPNYITFN